MVHTLPLNEDRLIRVGKATQILFKEWSEGASLVRDSGILPEDLRLLVAAHRWELGQAHFNDARRLRRMRPPPYRSVISRAYYGMYHAMRAVALVHHEGDDNQEHSNLPRAVPIDFPSKPQWAIKLKDARLTRNKADYDPYPQDDRMWKSDADKTLLDAGDLLADSRQYLIAKGCVL